MITRPQPPGARQIDYITGPACYAIYGRALYLCRRHLHMVSIKGFSGRRRVSVAAATMLAVVTMTPLAANAAYIFLGFTIFGLTDVVYVSARYSPFTFMLALQTRRWIWRRVGSIRLF